MQHPTRIFPLKSIALAGLFAGVVALPLNAADLREMLAAQAADGQSETDAEFYGQPVEDDFQPAAETESDDGLFESLSDFLGGSAAEDEGADSAPNDMADPTAMGDDMWEEETHYEGQALEPEQSDMFDDAFGDDTVRAAADYEADGPAPDDAPEDFTAGDDVETKPLAAPDGAEEMDIFGRPKTGQASTPAEGDVAFDFANLPPVSFKVPRNATVTVRALDKITARMSEHKLKVDKPYRFGTLAIVMRTCVKSPPEEEPEAKAFLQIADNRPEMENKAWFSGWMFASSPAISALEHPVYDVWVIDCNIVAASADDDNL